MISNKLIVFYTTRYLVQLIATYYALQFTFSMLSAANSWYNTLGVILSFVVVLAWGLVLRADLTNFLNWVTETESEKKNKE